MLLCSFEVGHRGAAVAGAVLSSLSYRREMSDIALMYGDAEQRVSELAAGCDPDTEIPACPDWTVHSLIAHLAGLAADVVDGRVDGYATDDWTLRQITSRRGRSVESLIDEWDALLPGFIEIMNDLDSSTLPETIRTAIGPVPRASFKGAFLVDLIQHEHDLRGALESPRPVLEADIEALENQIRNLRAVFSFVPLPTLEVSATDTDRRWLVGRTEPVAWLNAPAVELLRALGGRRTHSEIGELGWSGTNREMLEHVVLPFFEAPADSISGG